VHCFFVAYLIENALFSVEVGDAVIEVGNDWHMGIVA